VNSKALEPKTPNSTLSHRGPTEWQVIGCAVNDHKSDIIQVRTTRDEEFLSPLESTKKT